MQWISRTALTFFCVIPAVALSSGAVAVEVENNGHWAGEDYEYYEVETPRVERQVEQEEIDAIELLRPGIVPLQQEFRRRTQERERDLHFLLQNASPRLRTKALELLAEVERMQENMDQHIKKVTHKLANKLISASLRWWLQGPEEQIHAKLQRLRQEETREQWSQPR